MAPHGGRKIHAASELLSSFFLIFAGAAALATLTLFTRQPLLVAYIAIGMLLGPHGLSLVADAALLSEVGEFGIIFLLFLIGLDMQPAKLRHMLGKSLLTALGTSAAFFVVGFGLMLMFGYGLGAAVVTGMAVTFSSTILGVKLLPTTALHHRHIGEMVVSLLLIQDLLAIIALVLVAGYGQDVETTVTGLGAILVSLPALALGAYLAVRFVVLPLLHRFDAFREFIFLLAVGWCLGLAFVSATIGLSVAIGAFIAGVALATHPISLYIADSLRPVGNFFLVLFFFSVGAALDIGVALQVAVPAILLAAVLIALKPVTFAWLLRWQGEGGKDSWEVGFRLGQASEFSLLLSYVAAAAGLLDNQAAHIVQGATILTLIASSYLVVFRYPSPIATNPALRRD